MPDWQSPEELQRDSIAFNDFMHTLLGLYLYEWFICLDFEWDFISRKKKFRWPLIFYFGNRYLLLGTMIQVAISLDVTTQLDCQALYIFGVLAGDASVGLASINFAIRTMAIWSHNRYIVGFLVLLILGHWSLILQGIQLRASWVPGAGCVISKSNNNIFSAIFIYSMCFDLIVFLLTAYKLIGLRWNLGTRERLRRNRLAKMMFSDGLVYFLIAFLVNLVAAVFMLLDLNEIMGVIFNLPAATFSTIAASRAVRRLTNFSHDDVPSQTNLNSLRFKSFSLGAKSMSSQPQAQTIITDSSATQMSSLT